MGSHIRILTVALVLLTGVTTTHTVRAEVDAASEDPICRIAVMSNAYITALPAEEIREPSATGLGKSRSWLKGRSAKVREAAMAAVGQLRPDAFVLLGSLTWTGSDLDCAEAKRFLQSLNTPVYVTPGPRDLYEGTERFGRHFAAFGGKSRYWVNVKGAHLHFATSGDLPPGDQSDAKVVDWMAGTLEKNARSARAVLLFGGPRNAGQRPPAEAQGTDGRFWSLIDKHQVAVRITAGHDHQVFGDRLPWWVAPSMAWQEHWNLGLIEVYPERIELSLITSLDQPRQTLTAPNPTAAPRLAAADRDPHGNPMYTLDRRSKPLLTFVQIADTQIDDGENPRTAALYPHDEQMNEIAVRQINRLDPAFVVALGDLVNNNTLLEWKTFNSIYSQLKAPLYTVPGNHDAIRAESLEEASRDVREIVKRSSGGDLALYQEFTQSYASGGRPYFSFEKNGCVFIGIDNHRQAIDVKQLQWIRAELERTKNGQHVFVMGHYPLPGTFGNEVSEEEGGRQLLKLLKEYKVTAYLMGHRHRSSRYLVVDGTAHIHCEDLAWSTRGAYHALHVFPDKIVCGWKPVYLGNEQPLYERIEFPSPR